MRNKNVLGIALGVLTVIIGAYVVSVVQVNASLEKTFNSISEGMTKDQVIGAMGKPDLVREGCRDGPVWLDRPVPNKTCMSEFQYDARLLPKFWTVGFDAENRAIAKYPYVSP